MKIRKLRQDDGLLMLEWMHDENVVKKMRGNFLQKTQEDVLAFIESSKDTSSSIHLAIVDDDDKYMGTISLKNIDLEEASAEFGIAIRSCAMGKGYAFDGMKYILNYAFSNVLLKKIVWCVSKDNIRAVRFYDKHLFRRTDNAPDRIKVVYSNMKDLIWYECDKADYERIQMQ